MFITKMLHVGSSSPSACNFDALAVLCGQGSPFCLSLQPVARSDQDDVLEAALSSVHHHPHARICTTLGEGEDRYALLISATVTVTVTAAATATMTGMSCQGTAAMPDVLAYMLSQNMPLCVVVSPVLAI